MADKSNSGPRSTSPGLEHAVRTAEQHNDNRTADSARRMIEAGGRMSSPPGYYTRQQKRNKKRSNSR